MTRVAIYARVSTEEQDLDGQLGDLTGYAASRGWEIGPVYREKVTATGKAERGEYDRMVRSVGMGNFDSVLVWALDRFSREQTFTQATQAILDLEKRGVRFHSLKEPMLDTPEDGRPSLGRDVLLALLPVIAAFESKRRSERVRVAMREIAAGRRKTRSGLPPGRRRIVTPELADKARKVRESREPPVPWPDVARRVGLKAETCRRAVWDLKRAGVGVGNSHRGKGSP